MKHCETFQPTDRMAIHICHIAMDFQRIRLVVFRITLKSCSSTAFDQDTDVCDKNQSHKQRDPEPLFSYRMQTVRFNTIIL